MKLPIDLPDAFEDEDQGPSGACLWLVLIMAFYTGAAVVFGAWAGGLW